VTLINKNAKIEIIINYQIMNINRQSGQAIIVIAVVVGVLIAVGVAGYIAYQRAKTTPPPTVEQTQTDDSMVKDDVVFKTDSVTEDTMMEDEVVKDDEVTTKGGLPFEGGSELNLSGTVLAGTTSKFYDYNQADYLQALASDKLIVLYFYASWCPICRAETQNATYPAFNELNNPDVIGFRVNFNDGDTDKSEEGLAREFGVAYQHTKVFVKNGSRILKSPQQWDKDRYFEEINKNI